MKRHRNHILESKSLTALREVLPETWVVHEFPQDYGIDVQIEIFDTAGNSTGLRIYGQLKATDKHEEEDVLSLDRDHFEYWAAHSDPVLLLRYFAATGTFKWCWMHDIHWRMKPTASSVDAAPHLTPWNKVEAPVVIEQLARLRKQFLHQRSASPITISVRNNSEGITGSLRLAKFIENRLPPKSFIVLGEPESPCHIDVLFERKMLRLGFMGLPGFVLSCEDNDANEHLADLAVLFVFLILCRYNRSAESSVVANHAAPVLLRATPEDFFPLLFDGLFYSLGFEQAIARILGNVIDQKDPVVWFNIHAAGMRVSKRIGQTELWRSQLKKWADSPPYPEMAASAAYNAANSHANANLWHDALGYYKLAGERDRNYFDRDYYWAELGAAQFEAEQAGAASVSYQKAFDISHDPADQWRLGDALFHCGEYESAYNNISSAVANDESLGLYPRLVMAVCEELISTWGINKQEIRPVDESVQSELMASVAATSADELISKLKPFFKTCAIDPRLSFNAGHLSNISKQPRIALYRYLTCALRQRHDTQAWACAFISAFNANEAYLMALILDAAYYFTGEELIDAVLKAFVIPNEVPDETAVEVQRQLISLIRATAKSANDPATMRIHGSNSFNEIQI